MFDKQFGGGRFVAPILGSALLLLAVCGIVSAPEPRLDTRFIAFVAVEAVTVLAALAIMWPDRFEWVARGLAGIFGAALFVAVAWRLFEGGDAGRVVLAILGFFVIGLPALRYATTGGRADAAAQLRGAPFDSGDEAHVGKVGAAFAAKLDWLVAANPHLRVDGELTSGGRGRVRFPKTEDAGFDVSVEVTPGEVVIFAEDLVHVHFRDEDPADATAAEALRCVRGLLSPDARLTVRTASGRPYRATIETRTPVGWRIVTMTGLLFWNYLGRRSELVRQNRALPGSGPGVS